MSEIENSRQHIQKMGKILYRIAAIAKVILAVIIVGQLILTIAIFITPNAAMFIGPRMESNFFFIFLRDVAGICSMEPVYQAAIGCFVLLISYIVIFLLIKTAAQMLKYLANGERPLDAEKAKRIRHRSWYMLLFLFYNPILALVSFAMVVLFSYIMEYGGYIQQRADETNRIQEEMIMSFAEITENKSGQTGQHIKRVSEYARTIAAQLGLSHDQVEYIRIASTMHDVGKLLIPTEILEKPEKLTNEEYEIIKTHTILGGQLLENVEGEEMQLSRTIALQHHERPDGQGYPKGLTGDHISLESRIVAVADVYDALTSRRSYKNAWSEDDAYQEIIRGRGSQFDPKVVDAFVKAHDQILEVQERFKDQQRNERNNGSDL